MWCRDHDDARTPIASETLREDQAHGRNAHLRRVGEGADRPGGRCPEARIRGLSRSVADFPSKKISADRLGENGRVQKTWMNGMRDRARRKRRRRLLDGSKPAKGLNPTSAAGREKTCSSKAALSAAGSGTPRGKENAAAHDLDADDEPADAPLAWQVKPLTDWSVSLTRLTTPCASRPPMNNRRLQTRGSRDAQEHFAVNTRRKRTRRI